MPALPTENANSMQRVRLVKIQYQRTNHIVALWCRHFSQSAENFARCIFIRHAHAGQMSMLARSSRGYVESASSEVKASASKRDMPRRPFVKSFLKGAGACEIHMTILAQASGPRRARKSTGAAAAQTDEALLSSKAARFYRG